MVINNFCWFIFLVFFLEYDNNSYIIIKINIFKYDIENFKILFNSNFYSYKNFITKIFKIVFKSYKFIIVISLVSFIYIQI